MKIKDQNKNLKHLKRSAKGSDALKERKESSSSFDQLQDRILTFLHSHSSFDAGMMQRWVEQRADRLEKKERRFSYRIRSLFGRGKKVHESSTRLKFFAKQIEGMRLGVDPSVIRRFRQMEDEILNASDADLKLLLRWMEGKQQTYGKEILDLCDDLDKVNHPKIKEFTAHCRRLIDPNQAAMLNQLFMGETIQVEILVGARYD